MITTPYLTHDKKVGFTQLSESQSLPCDLIPITMTEAIGFLNNGENSASETTHKTKKTILGVAA